MNERLRFSKKERFSMNPKIGVIMGSSSDWETMKHTCDILDELQVPYEKKVVSAHRTPDLMFEYAATARARGIQVIVAGAGGAAHLPGMVASKTTLPVIGVPIQTKALNGLDSLLSIVAIYRSNAWWSSSCYSSYWKSRCYECWDTCCSNVSDVGSNTRAQLRFTT
jgi:hypothetical protein